MTENLDGLFNPFYSTSANDGSIVGMTQIGMIGADYDAKTNQISLKYDSGILNTKAITAYAYMNGANLQLGFAMDKLINILTTLGSNVQSLSAITALLQQYDGVKIGFEFSK